MPDPAAIPAFTLPQAPPPHARQSVSAASETEPAVRAEWESGYGNLVVVDHERQDLVLDLDRPNGVKGLQRRLRGDRRHLFALVPAVGVEEPARKLAAPLVPTHVGARGFSGQHGANAGHLFRLAGVALLVAGQGQESSDSMLETADFPLWDTFFIGTKNYLTYLGKCLVPIELSPFHPFPFQGEISFPWWYYLTPIPPLALAIVIWRKGWWKTHRKLIFGLAFFTICIGPYLQIIPYGKAIMAERYTYMSYLGLFYVLGIALERWQGKSIDTVKLGLAGVTIALFTWLTLRYIPVWENGETLWTRVAGQYPEHNFGFFSRGQWRIDHDDLKGGEEDLTKSIELNEKFASPYYERGRLREGRGEWSLALADYDQAIARGKLPRAYLNRAMIRANYNKDFKGAKEDLDGAIAQDPEYALAYLNRALVHRGMGLIPEAEADYIKTIELEPWNTVLYRYRGSFYEAENRLTRALGDFNVAVIQEPDRAENWFLRARVKRKRGDEAGYQSDVKEAQRLGFQFPEGFP